MQVLRLLHPVKSLQQEIMFSNTAKTVDIAANVINKKKKLPHTRPNGILLNICGKVTKMRLGPESTSTPYVAHAGKIISPATIATKVSKSKTFTDSPISERSLPI
jgi:hypothetical protein